MPRSHTSDIETTGGFLTAASSVMGFQRREAPHRRSADAVAIGAALVC